MSKHGSTDYEAEIVWQIDIEDIDYVREKWATAGTRTRPVPKKYIPGERIGYAVLAEDAPNSGTPGVFYRRIFFLKDHDRANGGDVYKNSSPAEAVDPRIVEPGKGGDVTPRVRGVSDKFEPLRAFDRCENLPIIPTN